MIKKILVVSFLIVFLLLGGRCITSADGPANPSPYSQQAKPEISPELEAEFKLIKYMLEDIAAYLKTLGPLDPVTQDNSENTYSYIADHIVEEIFVKKYGRSVKDVGCVLFGNVNPTDGLIYPKTVRVIIKGFADPEKIPDYIFDFTVESGQKKEDI
jgi:hypothetical protein